MKILIAVPTYETIFPDTFKSIYNMDKCGHEVDFDFVRGYDVANARNKVGQIVVDSDYDYVLMVDNDEVLPNDALANLLETEQSYQLGHNMVVGYCLSRPSCGINTSGRTTAFKFGGNNYVVDDAFTAEELKKLRNDGVTKTQIRGSGLGCALIHREIFESMKYPYFKWVEYRNRTQLSEDLYFCERFREIRKPIFVDTRVACGHMTRYIANI